MHAVLAIARVTLKDALRKKVLFTLVFFTALLIVSSGFLPSVMPDEQVGQVVKVCLGGIGFFGMIVAVFLSAPNLPDDISSKVIFTVMTKPARRWQILAGKILGVGYVLLILVGVMGALSFFYIKGVAWKAGPGKSGLPRLEANRLNYAKTVDYHGQQLAVSEVMVDSKRAIASGIDKITYHFEGLEGERFSGDRVFVQVVLFSHGLGYDKAAKQGTAAIEVKNPSTNETQTTVFEGRTLAPAVMDFPKSLVDRDGKVDVSVMRYLPTGSYSTMAGSVAVMSQPSSFGANFAKALAMMFVQYMVLVFLATAGSTFLTSTVSNIMALFVYFTGSFVEVLRRQALTLGSESDIFRMAQHTHTAQAVKLEGWHWVANVVLRYFYLGVSVLFPNFDYYDMSSGISQNLYISGGSLAFGVAYGVLYAALAFAVACAVFRRKEVA